jgi:hypothetical protein
MRAILGRMRRSIALLTLMLATTFAAGGSAAPSPTLSGQVIARGGGLGCYRAPCWSPVPKALVTILRGDRAVMRLPTGPDGRFRALLEPGVYYLRVPGLLVLTRDPGSAPVGTQRVVVRAGRTAHATLVIRARAGSTESGLPQPGIATASSDGVAR